MLKRISLVAILFIIISWLAITFYLGHQIQTQFNSPALALKNLHILHYEKGFNSSNIRFKLTTSTGNTSLNKLLHNAIFNADISHGPLVYTSHGIKIASTHWQVKIEQTSLPNDIQDLIKKHLPNSNAFKLNISFNFNDQGDYQLQLPPIILSELGQQIGDIALSHFSGKIDLKLQTINLKGKIGEINIKNNNGHLHIPTTEVYADSESDQNTHIKRKINFRSEKITYVSDNLPSDINFHFNLHIKQQLKDNKYHNTLALSIYDAITPEKIIHTINAELDYKEQINTSAQKPPIIEKQPIMYTLLQQLEQNLGSLTFSLNIIGKKGQIDLQAQTNTQLIQETNILKAQLSLNADKKYIDSTPFKLLFTPYIDRNVLQINNKKYQFNASINGNQATLNGITLPNKIATQTKPSTSN